MAAKRLCQLALCPKRLDIRSFHLSSKWGKKQYDYDLDSLVKWKQETNLLFGPQRKPTKNGKLKKRKKELDKQLQQNIETLSYVSRGEIDHSLESKGKKREGDFDVPAEFTSKMVPEYDVPNDMYESESRIYGFGQKNSTFPGHSSNFYSDRQNLNKNTSSEENRSHVLARSNLDRSNSNVKQSKVDKNEHASSPHKNGQPQKINSIEREQIFPISTEMFHTDKKQDGEIDIPKLEPVPPSKAFSPTKKAALPRTPHPPLEAPQSFEIVSKFPLAPQEHHTWQDGAEAQQLVSFKMDVEQMALRILPSVKTVLNKTMSDLNRFFLHRWREGMINELGEEGFKKHKNDTLRQGINLHANIMEFLSGKPHSELQIMPENEGHWSSLSTALDAVSDIRALETDVLHPALLYRGVFDCVARYKDLLCIIDWKVSKKPRPLLKNTYDDPLQVAAYVGALNADHQYVKQYGEVNHGLIVVAYPDGSPAHVHMMNQTLVEQYWQEWTSRLQSFYMLTYTEKMGQKQGTQVARKT